MAGCRLTQMLIKWSSVPAFSAVISSWTAQYQSRKAGTQVSSALSSAIVPEKVAPQPYFHQALIPTSSIGFVSWWYRQGTLQAPSRCCFYYGSLSSLHSTSLRHLHHLPIQSFRVQMPPFLPNSPSITTRFHQLHHCGINSQSSPIFPW